VVADGCTDDTVSRIAAFADPRIRVFDLPKAPYYGYANRNVALREARGDLVAFIAHDDLLFPDHLERLIRVLEPDREWVYSRPLWVSTDGILVPFATNLTLGDELDDFLSVGNTIPASCVIFRRRCLDRYGYWPEDVPSAADWRHWIAIIEGGGRRNLAYLPIPTCLHFSAEWKQSRHSAVAEVLTWLRVADSSSWWPGALRYEISAGAVEQQVIADAMRSGGLDWAHAVRDAVELVIDRLAWDDIRVVRPALLARERQIGMLTARVAELEAVLSTAREQGDRLREALQRELSVMLASRSWRLTAPIRALRRRYEQTLAR
jgi:glycosyltransferase involved in cell wall biosynthesis